MQNKLQTALLEAIYYIWRLFLTFEVKRLLGSGRANTKESSLIGVKSDSLG